MREVERVKSAPGAIAVVGVATRRWAMLGAVLAASLTWAALLVGATSVPAQGEEGRALRGGPRGGGGGGGEPRRGAGPPLSLSQRLRAQGHRVTPAEAAYF